MIYSLDIKIRSLCRHIIEYVFEIQEIVNFLGVVDE